MQSTQSSVAPIQSSSAHISMDHKKDALPGEKLYRLVEESAMSLDLNQQHNLNKQIMEMLDSHTNVFWQDECEMTALHIAISWECLDLVKILMPYYKENIDIEAEGHTPLYFAISDYHSNPEIYFQIIELLLQNGADPYYQSRSWVEMPITLAQSYPKLIKLISSSAGCIKKINDYV
ncbi:MAG: ankyrin repeat domain-containing protein [Chlamydiales bacterium]|nr:ankyrin repeat domain-containing protein [Chlamydiales bacterium]